MPNPLPQRIATEPDLFALEARDAQAVRGALALLRRFRETRPCAARIATVITAVEVRLGACEVGATCCTGGVLEGTLAFQEHPRDIGVVELAVLLWHEALHIDVLTGETLYHAFEGRPSSEQKAKDPIYRSMEHVRTFLLARS